MTVVHLLAAAAREVPEREALVCGTDRLTYAEYAACVACFARELREAGMQGGRVALLMGNSADAAIAQFAVQAAGAQLVPLNPLYTPAELGPILADAAPSLVVVDEAVTGLAAVYPRRVVGPGARLTTLRAAWCGDLLPDPDALASLQYTGGTTGRSKGVNLTHRAIAINLAQRDAVLPARLGERVLSVAPLYHVYAIAMGLHFAVRAQGTLVVMARYQAAELLHLLAAERISVFAGNPRLFADLLEHGGLSQLRGGPLRLCVSGSAALPEEVLRRWEDATGIAICEGYGQTEAGPVLTYNPSEGMRKPGTVGVALPSTVIEIVDLEAGLDHQPDGVEGEIRARGPQLMQGYRNRPEETAAALRDGWLYTGDIGVVDADGYLSIRGRRKEMVVVSGFNVYPREVEEVLHAHPMVHEAALVGRPDPRRGEALVAFVVVRGDVDAEELMSFLATRLARYKQPGEVRFVAALPRTSVGKVDKLTLGLAARSIAACFCRRLPRREDTACRRS